MKKKNTGIKTIPRGGNQASEKRGLFSHPLEKAKAHDTG